jgi:hypothetical protein
VIDVQGRGHSFPQREIDIPPASCSEEVSNLLALQVLTCFVIADIVIIWIACVRERGNDSLSDNCLA